MKQASVGFHCPDCVQDGGQKVVHAKQALAPAQPVVTIALIALNVAMYFYEESSGFSGAISGTLVAQGEWWRLLTAGFLHVSLIHIGMNMWALWQLGRGLEPNMGSVNFLIAYFGSLFGGSLAVATSDTLAEGASGAIFGLFGMLAMLYASRGISLSQSGIMGVLIMNLGISLLPGISWQGHLGGFVAGLLFGLIFFVWDRPLERINPQLPRFLALLVMVGLAYGGYYVSVALHGT